MESINAWFLIDTRLKLLVLLALSNPGNSVGPISITVSYFQVKNTFRTPSWWDHHETWKDMRYDWLPSWEEIPKHLHKRPQLSHLDELQVKTFQILNTVYNPEHNSNC